MRKDVNISLEGESAIAGIVESAIAGIAGIEIGMEVIKREEACNE